MSISSRTHGMLGGPVGRRSGGRVKTSTKRSRPVGGKVKIKIKGSPEQVQTAIETLAGKRNNNGGKSGTRRRRQE